MVHPRPTLPAGHGELLTRPAYGEWRVLVSANRAAAKDWSFTIGGLGAERFRAMARRDALHEAESFSRRLGVPVRAVGSPESPVIATGHQPELYHPGVWVKDFLIQRFADETGAVPLDLVVDSDGFTSVSVTAPCMAPGVARCRQYLALAGEGRCYACTPVPEPRVLEDFRAATLSVLESLPAPSVPRHFARFSECLASAGADARNLAELVTFARRRYEAAAGTDYLELPVTRMVTGEAFARFAAHIAMDARAFATTHNEELAAYRAATGTRSMAQPFPDLGFDGDEVELPFWWMDGSRRTAVWARPEATGVAVLADGREVAWLPREPDQAAAVLCASEAAGCFAPKALTLTMFVRLFCCDLFVHGVGGGRYDRVTDAVIRGYLGIEPPAFAVASITLYLPVGARIVGDEEVASAVERLNRFEHNPDELLPQVDFDDTAERMRAEALVSDKAMLVEAIKVPGADKKGIGARIREVNAQLAAVLAPLRLELESELERLRRQREASDILTDRTYPFCFWDPIEVADKVR